ncbi:MAG: rRNA adenine N-6-methyltransferase family protein, partial [Bacillota bacterium]|nr:rRNA adenine N-6-methyltransferase family protein [Bacillota bacterium]
MTEDREAKREAKSEADGKKLCLTSPADIRKIMERYGFAFSKSLGQNFLIDTHAVDKIVDAVRREIKKSPDSEGASAASKCLVIEIGPGFGVLTERLCDVAEHVIAIEKDKTLPPILREIVPAGNLDIICEDVLKCDLDTLIRDAGYETAVVVANLPYYIT